MVEQPGAYDLTRSQWSELLAGWEQPAYRAQQIWEWLYRQWADRWEVMTNLPAELRARLEAEVRLEQLTPVACQVASDRATSKTLFDLRDGLRIESVLMSYRRRRTACISSQAGCAMGCAFCATGQSGLARNLTAGEIVAQVAHFARLYQAGGRDPATGLAGSQEPAEGGISNVVLMGMGEPLANYGATQQAIATLTDPLGMALGARRITVSTIGIVPGIRRLAQEPLQVNLAVSLHAATDELRSLLVPINRRFPLSELLSAVRDYTERTGRRVTFEVALIAGVNDSAAEAARMGDLLSGLLCHANLIPLNPTPGSAWQPAPRERVDAFRQEMERRGVPTTVRLRRGIDIEAGCGQLRLRHLSIASR